MPDCSSIEPGGCGGGSAGMLTGDATGPASGNTVEKIRGQPWTAATLGLGDAGKVPTWNGTAWTAMRPTAQPYLVILDEDASAGDAMKPGTSDRHVAIASGTGDGDGETTIGILGQSGEVGDEVELYPNGSFAPLSGYPAGPLFRAADGSLTSSATSGIRTQKMAISDGTNLWVQISAEFTP